VRSRGLFNVTAVRYPDGWSATVWQSSDPPRVKRDRVSGGRKDESERWDSSKVRARARVRHLSRCLGVDHLWTFTKRGKFGSVDELWATWKEFCRLMDKRHGAKWRYLAVPELHSDGQTWHLHVGVRGFWDVNQLRVYWHGALGASGLVVGADSPGNVDAKHFRGRSVRAISGYISKYIGKGFGGVSFGRRLFSSSVGIRPLERRELHFVCDVGGDELHDAVSRYLFSVSGVRWWDARSYGEGVAQCLVFEVSNNNGG
jgi:hypothetical protein